MKKLSQLARRFGAARALSVVLLFALAALRVADPPLLEEIRLRTFDFFQVLRPRDAQQRPVVIADIDEKSLKALGQWPWPRTVIADLVTRLTAMGAVAVAFDVVFAEPDRMSPGVAAQAYRDLDDETRKKLQELPSNDQVLADAFKKSRVVAGESGLPFAADTPAAKLPTVGIAALGGDPKPFMVSFPGLLPNVPILETAAAGRGLFTIRAERDGMIRRVPMVMLARGDVMPSLSLEMLRVATQQSTLLIKSDQAGIKSVAIPGFEIPTDRNGQLWIHFSHHDPARYLPVADIIDGTAQPSRVAGKLVLVGTSAVGLLDVKTTPLDAVLPGVEVHAEILESVLTKAVLSAPNYAVGAELAAAILVGILIIAFAPVLGSAALLAFGAVVVALMVGTSWYFFTQQKLLIDFTYPLLSSLIVYLTLVFGNYFTEQAQKKQIRSAFGQYLSPALVEQLAKSPEKLVLGGEQRDMTIMFSDVRGFTSISEQYKDDPQGLTTLMNRLLTPLTNAVINRKGTIDKYMGDAIMAFWNAPIDDDQHQVNACTAALDMLDRIDVLNREREAEAASNGTPFIPMKVGVGINTGRCVVGNMGSDLRFDYSVLGDSVNLASRIEGQSKTYGLPVIVGSRTAAAAQGKFAMLEIDNLAVKGKKEPETVFAILGREDVAASGTFGRLSDLNNTMLACYRARDWDGAAAALGELRQAGQAIGPNCDVGHYADLYSERIDDYRRNPPPEGWTGVFEAQTK
ncbi:MAG: adenylate/guanylate cyclase domain-containing protein [Pseudolabrys sp.]|nr:adenylate/guanylate cyclase domain-containing protein [Pseudolabrys sp.]